ncbi:hypothetical protein T484DRAFT_1862134 [Baffinella frigidus]|nr:hypothetical protein T484DRAFT_1862134 [Cryptophyta sp. CCMP2293]
MEALRRRGPSTAFGGILLLRTLWAFAHSGGMLARYYLGHSNLLVMEVLRRWGPSATFSSILLLRTVWAFANSGGMLVDAMVVQMAHRWWG